MRDLPQAQMPACPDWIMPEAKKEWERLAELMNQMGVLTEVDMAAFAAYCQSYARWKEAQEHITSGGSTFETDEIYDITSVDHMNFKKKCLKFSCRKVRR